MKDILIHVGLKRQTFYYEWAQIQKPPKHWKLKRLIYWIYKVLGHGNYGYRRIWSELIRRGYSCCKETVRRLTKLIGIQVTKFNKHLSPKYHSYKGHVGRKAKNLLHQNFSEKRPYFVLHTDVTQVRLGNHKWAYISVMFNEASREIVAVTTSYTPKMPFIFRMLGILKKKIPADIHPIIHSDQGWQYQMDSYHQVLKDMGCVQSMSRKGNCHDNAPAESHFNIMKREFFDDHIFPDLKALRDKLKHYVYWFNHTRISMRTNEMSPLEYQKWFNYIKLINKFLVRKI